MTRLLLVEDNLHKRDRVIGFLEDAISDMEIIEAHSFTSAWQLLESQIFDVVLMDMSLPTQDKTAKESGGSFRTFGGRELARKMHRRGMHPKLIFLTQYDAFSDRDASHTIESLNHMLRKELADNYLGIVHYDSSKSAWKEEIERLIGT